MFGSHARGETSTTSEGMTRVESILAYARDPTWVCSQTGLYIMKAIEWNKYIGQLETSLAKSSLRMGPKSFQSYAGAQ